MVKGQFKKPYLNVIRDYEIISEREMKILKTNAASAITATNIANAKLVEANKIKTAAELVVAPLNMEKLQLIKVNKV